MMSYLKITLILIVITLQISDVRPGFWTFDHDDTDDSDTESDLELNANKADNNNETTADKKKTKKRKSKKSDGGAIKSDIAPQKKIELRKEDLEFIENLYQGKNKETYKEMSDKIYKSFVKNSKRASQQLKNALLLKAYVQTAHNKTEGVSRVYEAMKTKDLSHFLHDWYKMDYKTKKGEIHEVEKAIKHEEEQATRATDREQVSTEAQKAVSTEAQGVVSPGAQGAVSPGASEALSPGAPGTVSPGAPGPAPTEALAQEKLTVSTELDENEVYKEAEKVGLQHYSKEHLIQELVDEHRNENKTKSH